MLETKEIVSDEKEKPVLNEEILAKLLEAAWVLQEHNRAQQKVDLNLEMHSEQLREREQASLFSAPTPANALIEKDVPASTSSSSVSEDYTSTLAKIVETQHQIQLRQLDLESSMEMVLDRLIDITKASGAGVALLSGKKVRYPAAFGVGALIRDAEVEKEKALCFDCLRTGQVTRCPDVVADFLLDVEECRRRGIESLIAVPVYHEGGVAGALELYFASANAFRETDVHSCQLMAGLVTEALARDEELTWKKSLAEERSVMLNALEKIKPNLAALVGTAGSAAGAKTAPSENSICSSCNTEFVAGEQYCGTCGSPRAAAESHVSLQSKLGAFLNTQAEQQKADNQTSDYQPPDPFAPRPHQSSPTDSAAPVKEAGSEAESFALTVAKPETEYPAKKLEPATGAALAKTEDTAAWTSAAKAKDFLEQLAAAQRESSFGRFWQARRGDVYLAAAVILVAIVVRWGIWSEHSVSAVGTPTTAGSAHSRPADPNADLSVFDKMLISLGLADPPEVPENKGNPEILVWVDLHTALYYCPGADLYGKTPKGRYASQRDAQLDQFEPAYRKTCD